MHGSLPSSIPNGTSVFPLPSRQDPVATPDGFLFSREAILENLLAQKKANKRKLAAWKAQEEERRQKVCGFGGGE